MLTALLAVLFAALQPPPTAHLGFPLALLAWVAHIGSGMLCALLAASLLLRLRPTLGRRPWVALLLSGLVGATVFTPIALGLEALLPAPPQEALDDWLDTWEAAGGIRALAAEWLSLLPSYLPAWLLINAVPMLQVAQPRFDASLPAGCDPSFAGDTAGRADPVGAGTRLGAASPGLDGLGRGDAGNDDPIQSGAAADSHAVDAHAGISASPFRPNPAVPKPCPQAQALGAVQAVERPDAPEGLIDRLPMAIGRQLVSISSDLHYLQVVTRRGRATLLGSLAEAETELGALGLRIHRSHWVALDAVRRLRRSAQGWRCELQDGRSLPVSRRRAAEIRQRLGRDFVVEE